MWLIFFSALNLKKKNYIYFSCQELFQYCGFVHFKHETCPSCQIWLCFILQLLWHSPFPQILIGLLVTKRGLGKSLCLFLQLSCQSWNNSVKMDAGLMPAAWHLGRCWSLRKCHTIRCHLWTCDSRKSTQPRLSPPAIANTSGHFISSAWNNCWAVSLINE